MYVREEVAMSMGETTRSARLGFRISATQRALLSRAAAASDKSLTDFVLESASIAAENTLLDRRLFFADSEAFAKFEEALNAPAKVNTGLLDLLSEPAPWE
jgi:uncharacterized protein (DUF1778 family)